MRQRLGVAAVTIGFVAVVTVFLTAIVLGWRPGQWLIVGIIVGILIFTLLALLVLYWRARGSARRSLEESHADQQQRRNEQATRDGAPGDQATPGHRDVEAHKCAGRSPRTGPPL